ncbi:gamma-aminobutyric acid type B receptor subunit 1 isoform X2 [Pseudomyrmex gracilis]|uniref:gamma-aminobutyric acid type B receptor subunit 1 isoform X2 n=1 Tax=Pseudomyrmex gracilis TaxID=219809 RepID=UPI0009949493|nr:gamma-aminobutyric acid type B receptor subunit 1 isoform X2 [Pseudomyrmex gracilis]
MTRVRARRNLSRLLLLFSSSEALYARHRLTLFLLGLAFLGKSVSCDARTRSQSDFPHNIGAKRYSERGDLDVTEVTQEWIQRENVASSMAGQSASDVATSHHQSGNSLANQRNPNETDPTEIKRTYFDDGNLTASITNDLRGDHQVHPPSVRRKPRFGDFARNKIVDNRKVVFRNMRQGEERARRKWSDNYLVREQRGAKLAPKFIPHHSVNRAMSEVELGSERDKDASLIILKEAHQSEISLSKSFDRNDGTSEVALIKAPIDQSPGSRESLNANHLAQLAGSRQDRNEGSFEGARRRAELNTDNVFDVNRATERDYSARRNSRGNEEASRRSNERNDVNVAATRRDDLTAENRGTRGTDVVDFEATTQTHFDGRNSYASDKRNGKRGSRSTFTDYPNRNDNFDYVNESANSSADDVDTIAVDTIADDIDVSTALTADHQIENGIAEVGTEFNLDYLDFNFSNIGGTENHTANCRNGVCLPDLNSGDDVPTTKTNKFDRENGPNDNRDERAEHHHVQVSDDDDDDMSATPGNDSDIDTDSETPFTGFEGSQKFPVKINQKPVMPQVEKFDRRHFGPHKEDVLEEASTWHPSTALPDLPKSPGRDVLHRHRKTSEDVTATNDGDEGTIEEDEKRNDTFDESWLPGMSSGRRSPNFPGVKSNLDEKLATVTTDIIVGDLANATHDVDSDVDIGVTVSSAKSMEKINITILGLFEMTRGTKVRPEGSSELEAAKLAVDRVNESDILKRFRLRLIYNDTKCDSGVAVDRFFHALYAPKKKHLMPFLLGTACSEVTETLAKIVPYWNVIQVSFGSTAPALSDSNEFPLFLRTVAPDSSHNPARIALIKHFGWDTVTALSQTGDMYSLAVNDLVQELEQANITCTATITFAENDYKEQLRTLKDLDTRIIIGSFSPQLARRVFCEAWKLGMHGGDYAWILPGDTDPLEMISDRHADIEECSSSQLTQTLDGLIIVKSHDSVVGNVMSDTGLSSEKFRTELANRGVAHSKFAGQTYDAVWAMAFALARTEVFLNRQNESMANYKHTRRDFTYRLLEQLKLLHFVGVSGPVSFDDADRVGITAFYQMHGSIIRRIAIYTPEDGKLLMNCPGCEATRWPGGQVPAARRVFRLRMVTVAPAAFLVITCIASVGVTLALAFLAFNLHFRKHKSIKLSSPRLNNMAAVGCGLVYGAVILLGLDDATLPDSDGYYPTVCKARVYLLSAGFSLAFGSMFTKTYRVHRIFTRSRSGVVKNKLLQDTPLIFLICMLLVIDVIVVTLWVILDPMQRHLQNLTLEISPQDRGVVYQPQVEVCRSQHTNGWLSALYVYKGLLLVVGVYMAWETRHVKIPALNDSQYIGMSVYFVVITSGIVVVLANLMPDRATLAFVTITALILASTTATLALLFLPQLANILAGERDDPVVQSLGLKIECNTRRFVTDDRRELQYRVEVQNRVYRREMAQLELELARLEKQLAQEMEKPSRASSNTSIPQRNPSIGGGLPLLLLSVLPPVIPRASWPSADSSDVRERHPSRHRSI